ARFGERQVRLLRLAAGDSRVDRIFVHPTIKRALCEGFGGARDGDNTWLHKIRAWYGHDEHFHVRLGCPASSPDCVTQAPVPPGDGCDASLEWWFTHPPAEVTPGLVVPKPRRPPLPKACTALLSRKQLSVQRGNECADTRPADLDPDAHQDECRKPQHDVRAGPAQHVFETIGEPVTDIDRERDRDESGN